MQPSLDSNYWNTKYLNNNTGWDLGQISPPLAQYFNQIENKDTKILIPGAGNAFEAQFLHDNGFSNVHVLDISSEAIKRFQTRVPNFKKAHIHLENFFDHQGTYDLIIEQTFFCALDPVLREKYVAKMNKLLADSGKLVGLLFNIPLNSDHPPYGGHSSEYKTLFEPQFSIDIMEKCYNSINPRQDNELFIKMHKK